MADYPLPKFHFQVDWGEGNAIGFTEVSGLDVEIEPIPYRHGASPAYHKTQQPGLTKYSNITCKRGTFKGDNKYFEWWKKNFLFNNAERRDLVISLLNDDHEPIITWKVASAWPIKIQSTDLKADGNEIGIESMELVHEGLEIQND